MAEEVWKRFSGYFLDDQSEQDITRVAVLPLRSGSKLGCFLLLEKFQHLLILNLVQLIIREIGIVTSHQVLVIPKPRCVIQQVANRDLSSILRKIREDIR